MFHFTVVFFITVISDIAVHHASLIVRSTCLSATVFHWLPVFNHNLVKINPVYSNAEPHWWLICLLVSLSLTIQGSLRKYLVVLPAVLSLTWIKIVLNQTIHSSLCPANINARAHTHTHTHTHTRTHALAHCGGWSNLPRRLVSDWMSDAGDSCTHHSFYEYITFYVHPNTDLPSSGNQTGQTFTHRSPGKLELSERKKK